MKLLDIVNGPWAIDPDRLVEIRAIYATHLRGDKIDIAALEQRLGRPLNNEPKPYQIVDGVAVIELAGVIAKRANLFSQISGGVSTELAARDLQAADQDPAVHSIILRIDSPGGTVDGTETLADLVAHTTKPVVALASGMMASAAYWIGSAANSVYIEEMTTQVGSIGVVIGHKDISGAEEKQGVKTTEITAGKYKRVASQYGPLTKDGAASLQAMADSIYGVFVDAVATNRGVSVEKVLADMADGRVFVGQQAIDAGLVDGVSTLGSLIAQLNTERTNPGAGARNQLSTPKGEDIMNRDQLIAAHPELFKQILAEGHTAGAAAEKQRLADIDAAALPGHEALIASLKADGTTTGVQAAHAVLAAERKLRTTAAADLASDAAGAGVIRPASTPAVDPKKDPAADADAGLSVEERCKASWQKDPKVRAEFVDLEGYTAFTKANERGAVRLFESRKAAA